jgi:hypothetical protein
MLLNDTNVAFKFDRVNIGKLKYCPAWDMYRKVEVVGSSHMLSLLPIICCAPSKCHYFKSAEVYSKFLTNFNTYIHIYCFYLPKLPGSTCCFLREMWTVDLCF